MSKYNPKYLDQEEEELMEEIEKMDFEQIKRPTKEEQKPLKDAARQYIQKETKMNIQIDPYELEKRK